MNIKEFEYERPNCNFMRHVSILLYLQKLFKRILESYDLFGGCCILLPLNPMN